MTDRRVCWTHGQVNVCVRETYVGPGCEWRQDGDSVAAVSAYQLRQRKDWRDD